MSQNEGKVVEVKPPKEMRVPMLLGRRGVALETLDDLWRFSKIVLDSKIGIKGVETQAAIFVVLEFGLELEMTPMQAIQNIYVINGRPAIYGDFALARVKASGKLQDIDEHFDGKDDAYAAVCVVRRVGEPSVERRFSVTDAKRAKLWGKVSRDGQPSPWVLYPQRMLQMRARSWALRDVFPDVLKGISIVEDIQDIEAEPVELKPTAGRVKFDAKAFESKPEPAVAESATPAPPEEPEPETPPPQPAEPEIDETQERANLRESLRKAKENWPKGWEMFVYARALKDADIFEKEELTLDQLRDLYAQMTE